MANKTNLNENLAHSVLSPQEPYPYRSGCGIIPSGEFAVFVEDFFSNPTSNAMPGASTIIDTGATLVASATTDLLMAGAGRISCTATSGGVANYYPKGIQLGQGKKFYMEVGVQASAVADCDLQFGLTDLTAVVNPEDLFTTTAANLATFGLLVGSAIPTMLCDKGNSGSTAEAGTITMVNATTHVLGIEIGGKAADSTMYAKAYVDGKLAVTWSTETTIPDNLVLAPFFAARNGSSTSNTVDIDYVRWSLER